MKEIEEGKGGDEVAGERAGQQPRKKHLASEVTERT